VDFAGSLKDKLLVHALNPIQDADDFSRRILKLDPWRLKTPETKRSDRVHRKPQTTFFTLPPDIALPEPRPVATSLATGCLLLVERPDGARLALTPPSLDLSHITQLCADFLRD
jgi:hypothetical protein